MYNGPSTSLRKSSSFQKDDLLCLYFHVLTLDTRVKWSNCDSCVLSYFYKDVNLIIIINFLSLIYLCK